MPLENVLKRRGHHIAATLFSTLSGFASFYVCAQPDDEAALAEIYGSAEMVSIATGITQPLRQSPAIASVVTAEDMAAIGATELNEVLETIPGLHVGVSGVGYKPIFSVRGIHTQSNPQILVLINGLPIMLNKPKEFYDIDHLDRYYRHCVIGGEGAFIAPVFDLRQLSSTIRKKLVSAAIYPVLLLAFFVVKGRWRAVVGAGAAIHP